VLNLNGIEQFIIWAFLTYVILCSGSYLILNLIAFDSLRNYLRQQRTHEDETLYTGLEPPISVIVPAYNEGKTIVASLRSILQLNYPNMEIVVVNDGSTDNTVEVMKSYFEMEEFPEAPRISVPCEPIRKVYLSRRLNNLRLIDKENGGKADAINAGINLSRSPLFCCIDADSVLEPSSLLRVVQPFLTSSRVVATGGTVRVANGCKVKNGHLISRGIPKNPLALFQLVEYLRAFLFGRIGWSRIRGLLIISGAFGVFKKRAVVDAGGYAKDTIGEDMELILRMYRTLNKAGVRHRIEFIPDPVCWTEVPEDLKVFASQRKRWHRGLSESLYVNRELMFSKGSGTVGWVSFPFFILFEWLSPFIELAGYLFTLYLFTFGKISFIDMTIVFSFAVMLSVLLSVVSFLLDEITFPGTTRIRSIAVLLVFSFLECFGYRQLNMLYKIQGSYDWFANKKHEWGEMTRSGSWQNQ